MQLASPRAAAKARSTAGAPGSWILAPGSSPYATVAIVHTLN
jgi:hypothetical protein